MTTFVTLAALIIDRVVYSRRPSSTRATNPNDGPTGMCGIFGVVFHKQSRSAVEQQLIDGLRALEYRGYDSAGMAVQMTRDVDIRVHKCAGRVQALANQIESSPMSTATSVGESGAEQRGVGVAHTRWATHGPATARNAHPHVSADGAFAVVHNGIITNHTDLRALLEVDGYAFQSDTDTEIVAALCQTVFESRSAVGRDATFSFPQLVRDVTKRLDGAFALLIVSRHAPGELVAARRGSPLIIGLPADHASHDESGVHDSMFIPTRRLASVAQETGLGAHVNPSKNGDAASDYFFSSDTVALAPRSSNAVYMRDNMIAHVDRDGDLSLYHTGGGAETSGGVRVQALDVRLDEIGRHGYDDFMLKEIMEQPESIRQTMAGRLRPLDQCTPPPSSSPPPPQSVGGARAARGTIGSYDVHFGGIGQKWRYIRKASRLLFFGCGTSHHAALLTQSLFERFANRPVHIEMSSDFLDRKPPIYRDDVCVFVSQSGETADTLKALDYCRQEGDALCVGIVNTVGSSVARRTDCGLYLMCGKEIGVASTKAYSAQVVALTMFACRFARHTESSLAASRVCSALARLPEHLRQTLERCRDSARRVADALHAESCHALLLVGRARQHATCKEGALKIKEITYVHTEAIAAGELKHGSLALVDSNAHILVVATHDDERGHVQNALSQLMARGGRPFLLTDDDALASRLEEKCRACVVVPRAGDPALQGSINVLPLQLIAYHLAKLRGCNVDMPRNLAKSVTVE